VIEAKVIVGVQPFGRNFFKPVIATLVAAAFLLASRMVTDDNTWLETGAIAVGAAVYLVALRALGLDEEERHVWNRIRKRAFKRGGRKTQDS
jgi:hypothetical protein